MYHVQEFHKLLTPKTKLVSLVHVSNALACVLDTQQVYEAAQKVPSAPNPSRFSYFAACTVLACGQRAEQV